MSDVDLRAAKPGDRVIITGRVIEMQVGGVLVAAAGHAAVWLPYGTTDGVVVMPRRPGVVEHPARRASWRVRFAAWMLGPGVWG